jgi:peptide/nickel transport system permease protein
VSAGVESAAQSESFESAVSHRGPWRQALDRFRRRPLGVASLALIVLVFVVGAFASVIAPYYAGQEFLPLIGTAHPPLTPHHFLGTDVLGRDFLTQLLFALRETALSSLVCAGGGAAIGVTVGALAGFYGGWLDDIVSWATRVVVAVPAIAVLIVIGIWHTPLPLTPLDDGLWLMALLWPGIARVVRAAVRAQSVNEYVEAARASGSSSLRILVRHVLPNVTGAVTVAATNVIGQSIAIIATVDYLGYGHNQAERPTLGGLVADATAASSQSLGRAPSIGSVWWLYVIPTVLLVLVLLAVSFAGDALDDALNPASA